MSKLSFKLLVSIVIFSFGIGTAVAQSEEDVAKGQALFNSGNEMISKGDFSGAVQAFTSAATRLPSWHLPYLNRGVAHLSLMNLVEAGADAQKALSLIQPGSSSAAHHAGVAHQVLGTVNQYLKDYGAALEHFSRAVALVPSDAKFHNSQGTAFRLLGRHNEALASYTRAIELDSKVATFYVNRASINERLKANDAALKDLDEALRLDKNLGTAYYTRANLKLRSKAFPEALLDYNEAIRLEPTKSAYFHARAILHHTTRAFELAIKDHTQAITLDPRNANAFSDRSIAHMALGNIPSAIEDVKVAITLTNESSVLRYNLAYFYHQNGLYSKAIDATTEVISRSPNWREPYLLRSNAYVKLDMPAKAKADREKASQLGPNGRPANEPYLVFDLDVSISEKTKP